MIIYNTTYHVDLTVEDNFVIWIKEVFIPSVLKQEVLKNPRFHKILSHVEPGQTNYALQWEVDSPATLHKWHMEHASFPATELAKIFDDKVLSFDTLMRVVE